MCYNLSNDWKCHQTMRKIGCFNGTAFWLDGPLQNVIIIKTLKIKNQLHAGLKYYIVDKINKGGVSRIYFKHVNKNSQQLSFLKIDASGSR